MPANLQSKGDIESIIDTDDLGTGKTARLVFRLLEEASPPFTVKVKDPAGKVIIDRVLRQLPTGEAQSAPPIMFMLTLSGKYDIDIRELYGKMVGTASLNVS